MFKIVRAIHVLAISVACISLSASLYSVPVQAEVFVYWADSSAKKIQRASVDNGIVEDLVTLPSTTTPLGIALDVAEGKVYWTECCNGNVVQRANLDGSNVEQLLPNANGDPQGGVASRTIDLDLTNRKLYVIDAFINGLGHRSNLDGTNVEQVLPFTCDRAGVAVDPAGGKIYISCRSFDRIERANLDGSGFEVLVVGPPDPRQIGLDLDSGKVYWADATGKIQRANLDGTGFEDVITGLGFIHGLSLDLQNGKIYWSAPGADKIQRANLDGSEIEDIVTGIPSPVAIALQLGDGVQTVTIDIKPGSDPNSINLSSAGLIPVAILSSETFDALTVNEETIFLAGAVVRVAGSSAKFLCHEEDVNDDGLDDLVCQVETAEFLIVPGEGTAELTAETFDGTAIQGTDSIRIVPD